MALLSAYLPDDEPRLTAPWVAQVAAEGISDRTMYEARRQLRVRATKDGFQGRSMMVLDRFHLAERYSLPNGRPLVTELLVGETPDELRVRHAQRVRAALSSPQMQYLQRRRAA